jgi:hypothetical protein
MAMLIERGDLFAADRELAAFTRLAQDLRQPVWDWLAGNMAAFRAIRDGRFEAAERGLHEALALGREILPFAAPTYFAGLHCLLRILQGRASENLAAWRAMVEAHPEAEASSTVAWMESEAGNAAAARAIVARLLPGLARARDSVWILTAGFCALAAAAADDADSAPALSRLLAPYASRWIQWADVGALWPVALPLGMLARVQGELDQAAAHLETALAAATAAGARPLAARTRYEYALALGARARPGDADRAAALLAEAAAEAASLGMAGLHDKAVATASAPPPGRRHAAPPAEGIPLAAGGRAVPADAGDGTCVFRREGDYWTIRFAGTTVRLRDMRGLHYLAPLLRAPGRELHASELVGTNGGLENGAALDPGVRIVAGLGDAGPALDARARAAYRERLRDLREELDEAERLHDLGRLERARAEVAALRAALAEGARRAGTASHSNRARLAVTKGIGKVVARIAEVHPSLGAHLDATVRRGYFCVYRPDPRQPIAWQVE